MKLRRLLIGFSLILLVMLGLTSQENGLFIRFAWASPDSYGNDVSHVVLYYFGNNTFVYNFTSSGDSTRVHDGYQIDFDAWTKYNVTLASDNASARSYTKCNMTIYFAANMTAVTDYDNVGMTQVSSSTWNDTSFYYVEFYLNWTTNLAAQGMQYNCTFNYQPYY